MLAVEKSIHPLQPAGSRACALAPASALPCLVAALLLSGSVAASAQGAAQPWVREVQQLASRTQIPPGARIEVEVGTLDPRLKLAPCARITPYVPSGARLWGRTHMGLRCDEGARWNVFIPITVKVFADAWTATQTLLPGTVLEVAHLQRGEVDLAAESSPVIQEPDRAVGRMLTRALQPGQAIHEADLKARQWFAAGDIVRVVTVGSGFAISVDGQALSPGIDGQMTKVRIDGGRIVSGRATAERRIEIAL
jgi:flagella basal body P-ring formation protein FlgA